MADLKISQLTGATTPLAGTEVLPIVQSSSTKKVAVSDLTAGRSVSMSDATLSTGNLNFSSTGQRITGDFSNATLINRVSFQSTTANGNTRIPIIPNGTATTSELIVFNNSTPTNSQGLAFFISNTQTSIRSNGYGTGTSGYLPLTFYTNGTEQVNIDTSGNITFKTGNLTQGTAARGVNFTANTPAAGMTSQLLNWYETGTWTPAIEFTTSGSATYNGQYGYYTRVGNVVTVNAWIYGNTVSSPVGDVKIVGFPFSVVSNNPRAGAMLGSNQITAGGGITGQIFGYLITSSMFVYVNNNGAQTALAGSKLNTNFEFYINFSYLTA